MATHRHRPGSIIRIRSIGLSWLKTIDWSASFVKDEKANNGAFIDSVGIVVENNEDNYILAASYDHRSGQYLGIFIVPKSCVREVTELDEF